MTDNKDKYTIGQMAKLCNVSTKQLRFYSGTDAGTVVPHGEILSEVAELASLGGGAFAIKASSWGARSWLGADSLAEGASADLIVTDTDPRADTGVLRDPVARVLRGRLIS